jgi:hypothetical protein
VRLSETRVGSLRSPRPACRRATDHEEDLYGRPDGPQLHVLAELVDAEVGIKARTRVSRRRPGMLSPPRYPVPAATRDAHVLSEDPIQRSCGSCSKPRFHSGRRIVSALCLDRSKSLLPRPTCANGILAMRQVMPQDHVFDRQDRSTVIPAATPRSPDRVPPLHMSRRGGQYG